MSDIVLLLAFAVSFLALLLLGVIVYRRNAGHYNAAADSTEIQSAVNRATSSVGGAAPPIPGLVPRGIRAQRNVRQRMRVAANREEFNEEDEDLDTLGDEIALPDGKLGAKKRKKLEQKAEKRASRERETEEREERKQRQAAADEQRKKEEETEKLEEAKQLEEEKRLKEEKDKSELEEYLKLKESFQVDEEGFNENEQDLQQNTFQDFINYINSEKVVLLEELASHFKLRTQDCVDRVQTLLEQEQLLGVIDDRGKFIAITTEELESVAKFIRQRGRVLISELVDSSNQLITLQQAEICIK